MPELGRALKEVTMLCVPREGLSGDRGFPSIGNLNSSHIHGRLIQWWLMSKGHMLDPANFVLPWPQGPSLQRHGHFTKPATRGHQREYS